MNDDQFNKLFNYMQDMRRDLDDFRGEVRNQFSSQQMTTDHIISQYDTLVQELAAGNHASQRVSDELENHEHRIVKLEQRAA